MGCWLGGFGVLVEGMFFPMLPFSPGNETKLSSNICGIELGKMLPEDDCSEFMLITLSAITCFGGNNCWVEWLQITKIHLVEMKFCARSFVGYFQF